MLCLARKGYKAPTICNLLKAENLSCTRENVVLFLKRYAETHSITRKQGSGRLSKVTAEIKALFEQQMHIDDETTAHQLHRLLQSRGDKSLHCSSLQEISWMDISRQHILPACTQC